MKITVVGSGGWGTALALVLEENGHDVTLWSHRPEKAEELKRTRENPMQGGAASGVPASHRRSECRRGE